MSLLPSLRRATPPALSSAQRETFLQLALLGMTLTVTALLGYIAARDDDGAQELSKLR